MLGLVVVVLAAGLLVALDRSGDGGAASVDDPPTGELGGRVDRVVDGDTVRVRTPAGEETVRLIGIDTPETKAPNRPVECFGPEASARAEELMPPGARVVLELDPTQDTRDRYGRLLAYVHVGDGPRGPDSVNRALVQSGHAEVYVFRTPFRYTAEFSRAEQAARDGGRGLWGRCPEGRAARAGAPAPDAPPIPGAGCDPAYVGACVPTAPPDLDCDDLEGPIRVVGADPHRLDGDGDGVACG